MTAACAAVMCVYTHMTTPDNFFRGKTMLIAICDDEQRELEDIEAALAAAALELSADIRNRRILIRRGAD